MLLLGDHGKRISLGNWLACVGVSGAYTCECGARVGECR